MIIKNNHSIFMKLKIYYYSIFIVLLFTIFFLCFSTISYGAYPKLISKLTGAFDKITSYIISIATPAAAVSIGSGFLMQKFSFGDEERIRMGKKIIRASIVSYAFILVLDLVISAIQAILS